MNNQSNPIVNFFRSIQGQLIVWFSLLGIIPLLVLGGIAWINTDNALRDATEKAMLSLASTRATSVENFIADSERLGIVLSQYPSLRGVQGQDIGLPALISNRNNAENRVIYDRAASNIMLIFESLASTYARIEGVLVTDASGLVYVSNIDGIAEGTNASQSAWLMPLAGITEVTVSDLQLIDNVPFFFVYTPITSQDGRIIGYTVIKMNTDRINSSLGDREGLGETGETLLVDLNTRYVLSELRFLDNAILSSQSNSYAVQQAAAGTEDVAIFDDYRQVQVVGAWNLVEGTNWVLVAKQDTVEAFMPVTGLTTLLLTTIIVSAILITVSAYLLARMISKPIGDLASTASSVAQGDFSKRSNINSKNEIGTLSNAFDKMTENLQTLFKSERESKAYLEDIVSEYSQFIEEVANGNLTIQLELEQKVNDQELHRLGANLNMMVKNLSEMALQIDETASSVSAAAAEILASTTQQIASTTEQEAAVTQTMTTVEEVKATVRQTSERAQNVAEASRQSVQISLNGQNSVADSINGMKIIREKVEGIAENILMLSERTQQIGEIIETVNEIAAQSKLLALNASIEAARAGEDGKGFAVVAMEVRQLAEQSREATARVRDILNQIQQATNTAVMVTEEGSKGAESGMSLVERAGESIEMLSQTIEEASQAAIQIAASTNQQNNGMEQLAQAMASIKQASTQTAASTRQAERSAKDLNDMAHRMQEAVRRYQLR